MQKGLPVVGEYAQSSIWNGLHAGDATCLMRIAWQRTTLTTLSVQSATHCVAIGSVL